MDSTDIPQETLNIICIYGYKIVNDPDKIGK